MKLLGQDISGAALLERIEERLKARGLFEEAVRTVPTGGVEARVDPLSFNVSSLEAHADCTQPMPLHSHRGGLGRAVVWAKWAFRNTCQVFINETLSRQRLFNGHVRDSYAQLSAEVLRLQKEVESLKAQAAKTQAIEITELSDTPRPAKTVRVRRK